MALRKKILGVEDGAFLGSEDDLVSELGVSRPTFRQAAKLVEQEQLLTVRRGVGGGFFTKRPTSSAVAHVTAVYLQSRNATLLDAIEASRPLVIDAARLGARNCPAPVRERLGAFLEQEEKTLAIEEFDFREFLRSERAFGLLIAEASGNPLVELYLLVLYEFAATLNRQSLFYGRPDRAGRYRELRNKVGTSILEGDPGMAVLFAERYTDYTIVIMDEELAGSGPPPALARAS